MIEHDGDFPGWSEFICHKLSMKGILRSLWPVKPVWHPFFYENRTCMSSVSTSELVVWVGAIAPFTGDPRHLTKKIYGDLRPGWTTLRANPSSENSTPKLPIFPTFAELFPCLN